MYIDQDIESILDSISRGVHQFKPVIEDFIAALPGFKNNLHSQSTVKKYYRCLVEDPKYSFIQFMESFNVIHVEETTIEHLEKYKDMLLNKLEPQTVRSYVNAVRQLFKYVHRLGWLENDIVARYRLPEIKKAKNIRTVPKEVEKLVLGKEWGSNPFTVSRNRIILYLFLRHGLHPLEFPRVKLEHVHSYEDLFYLSIYGKKKAYREVMLDAETVVALKEYMIERAHHIRAKKIKTDSVFLSLTGKNGNETITKEGVEAILRRIKEELQTEGCFFDLTAFNAQGCRRTAASNKYELAEYLPIHHPEFTICGELGHSLEISQKHYWKRSLKNKYLMAKSLEELQDRINKDRLAGLDDLD